MYLRGNRQSTSPTRHRPETQGDLAAVIGPRAPRFISSLDDDVVAGRAVEGVLARAADQDVVPVAAG